MIDAGSTGSRVFIYHWSRQLTGTRTFIVPKTNASWSLNVRPGINAFSERPSNAGLAVQALFQFARDIIGQEGCGDRLGEFPIYLKASAGMRLLDFLERDQILTVVRAQAAVSGFYFDVDNIRVISGEEEGVYGWISVNWLQGTMFDTLDAPGVLDLGGSSAQITFTPVDHHDIVAGYFPLRFRGTNIRLYTHSYLQYGHEAAMYRVNAALVSRTNDYHHIPHPCVPKGSKVHGNMVNHTDDLLYKEMPHVSWKGTGNYDECLRLHLNLLDLDHAACSYSSCSFAGVYQPRLLTRRFIGIGHIGGLVQKVLKMNQDSSLEEIRDVAIDVCGASEDNIQRRFHKADPTRLCSSLVWMFTLLHYGFGFPLQARQIQFTKPDIGQLGAMMYEANQLPWASNPRPLQVLANLPTNFDMVRVPSVSALLCGCLVMAAFVLWYRKRRAAYESIKG
jgi:Golgi nucleoside diphosphatase